MQQFKKRYGQWGLVAGGAEGLGAAFSEVLASWGMNLILVDVDEEKLTVTTDRLKELYGVETIKISADLSQIHNLQAIIQKMTEVDCRLMIYNAAYGPVKGFLENTIEELDYYIDLNSRMPLHLVYRFIKVIPEGQRAGILIMSSLAGLWGTQLVVPYGATKAVDYNLAEGLHYELKYKHIDVMACCAGATDTPNYKSTRPKKIFSGPTVLKPRYVAEKALRKLGKRAIFIPGLSNQLTYFLLTRVFPRSFSMGMMNRIMFKMYRT
jgi:short-subunit dehydrogenase